MEEGGENLSSITFESSVSELQLSPERSSILREGLLSAKQNKDFLQARFLTNVWSSRGMNIPQEVQELNRSLEREWKEGTINIKFDTQLEDETVIDEEEIVFKKIQRCTNQNKKIKSDEGRVFAVVIPSYWKEEEDLPHTLDSIHRQRFDDTVIVVVSDNNDEEGRQKFDVSGFAKGRGANVAMGSLPGNLSFARRKGIDRALISEPDSADMIIISSDSDSKLEPGYLISVRETYEDKSVISTSGPVHFGSDKEEFLRVEDWVNNTTRKMIERRFGYIIGPNSTIRSDIYRKLGGYCLDYKWVEDGNMSQKIADYLKYEGKEKDEKTLFVPGQVVTTSPRRLIDEEGNISQSRINEYKRYLGRIWLTQVTHIEGLGTILRNPRDRAGTIIFGQLRKLKDKMSDLKYLFSREGEKRVRNMIRILRTWDNFYQRVNNYPEVKEAVLNDTQKARDDIDSTFQREFQERGADSNEEVTSVLEGTVLQEEGREVSVFVVKKKSEKGTGNRYLAVEVERDPSSDRPPIIASLVEIDEGADEHFTRVSWYPERMYFHPDDDYPRTATLIFNTHHASISKVPTKNVDLLIGEDEIKKKAGLLFSAYENSKGEDNKIVEMLRDYVSI